MSAWTAYTGPETLPQEVKDICLEHGLKKSFTRLRYGQWLGRWPNGLPQIGDRWRPWPTPEQDRKCELAEMKNEKLAEALKAISRRVPIMGSQDEYRRGQLDALEACRDVALKALEADNG